MDKAIRIGTTAFARGHNTPSSGFSYYTKSWEELQELVAAQLSSVVPGYREGVVCVNIPDAGDFRSTLHNLQEGDIFTGEYVSRMPGEEPRKQLFVLGEPDVAVSAQVILYSSVLLADEGNNSLPPEEGNWEIVTILASAENLEGAEPMPMPPDTLIANHFQMSGGTDTQMSDSEFVESLHISTEYWKSRALKRGAKHG